MKGCVLSHTRACEDSPWRGGIERHHVITKQRLKREVDWKARDIDVVLADPRNLVNLCHRHHHRITHGWDRPLLADHLLERLPELTEFAFELEMISYLERELRLYGLAVTGEVGA